MGVAFSADLVFGDFSGLGIEVVFDFFDFALVFVLDDLGLAFDEDEDSGNDSCSSSIRNLESSFSLSSISLMYIAGSWLILRFSCSLTLTVSHLWMDSYMASILAMDSLGKMGGVSDFLAVAVVEGVASSSSSAKSLSMEALRVVSVELAE